MKFEHLQQRVARAERRVHWGSTNTEERWLSLRQTWRVAWTPPRILLAGLASGFIVGRANPVRSLVALGGTHWLELLGSVSGLVASFHAKDAAGEASDAVADAGEAAVAANAATAQAADVAAIATSQEDTALAASRIRSTAASGARVDVDDVPETWRHHGHL